MFCTNCGTQNTDDSMFCAGCGTPLNSAPQAPVNPTEPAQPYQQQPYQQQPYQQQPYQQQPYQQQPYQQQPYQQQPYQQQPYQQQPYQQPYQQRYGNPQGNAFLNNIKSYQQPAGAISRAPFPAYILKFIRMGIWLFYVLSIFFSWFTIKVDIPYLGDDAKNMNLFDLFSINDDLGDLGEMMDVGSDVSFTGIVIFAVVILLVLLGVVAVQVMNNFTKTKIPVPQIVLCAAPAVITLIYIIVAGCSLDIIINSVVAEFGEYISKDDIKEAKEMIKEYVSMGAGFGAWLVFILSLIETAIYFVFMRDRNAPIFEA